MTLVQNEPKKIYKGSTEIKAVYLGTTKVRPSGFNPITLNIGNIRDYNNTVNAQGLGKITVSWTGSSTGWKAMFRIVFNNTSSDSGLCIGAYSGGSMFRIYKGATLSSPGTDITGALRDGSNGDYTVIFTPTGCSVNGTSYSYDLSGWFGADSSNLQIQIGKGTTYYTNITNLVIKIE